MKKSNLIITLTVALVISISSIGAILGASGVFAAGTAAPVQTTTGVIQFDAPSGIRWNNGKNTFEIFNAAGVSYISSNEWVNATGDIKPNATYANETVAAAAGFYVASPLKTYHIMQDIIYENSPNRYTGFSSTPPNLGSITSENTIGIIDGKGYTLFNFPARDYSFLIFYNFGTIRNLNMNVGEIEIETSNTFGSFVDYNHGIVENCSIYGKLTFLNSINIGGIVGVVEKNAIVRNCVSNATITAIKDKSTLGGIISLARNGGTVQYSINHSSLLACYVGGIAGKLDSGGGYVLACFNDGIISTGDFSNSRSAGIASRTMNSEKYIINGCVNIGKVIASLEDGIACGVVNCGPNSLPIPDTIKTGNINNGTLVAKTTYDLYFGEG